MAFSPANITSATVPRSPLGDDRGRAPADGVPAPQAAGAPEDRVTISHEARARSGEELPPEEQRRLLKLQQRDLHVRAHESAHQAAGGGLAGGASFTYELGPDGRSYAVGGEVPITVRTGGSPDATIANARQVRQAALAPADPSPQDLAVAAQAMSVEQAALAEKARQAGRAYARAGDSLPERHRESKASRAEGIA